MTIDLKLSGIIYNYAIQKIQQKNFLKTYKSIKFLRLSEKKSKFFAFFTQFLIFNQIIFMQIKNPLPPIIPNIKNHNSKHFLPNYYHNSINKHIKPPKKQITKVTKQTP